VTDFLSCKKAHKQRKQENMLHSGP